MSIPFPDPPQAGSPPPLPINYSQYNIPDTFPTPDPAAKSNMPPGVFLPVPPYLGFGIQINYFLQSGQTGQPVAADGNSQLVDFVRLHTGRCVKVITFACTREFSKPVVPSPDTLAPNDVLINVQLGSFAPSTPYPDGTRVFGVVGRYTYVMQRMPNLATDSLDMGSRVDDPNLVSANTINPSDYVTYLTAPAAAVTNGGTTQIPFP